MENKDLLLNKRDDFTARMSNISVDFANDNGLDSSEFIDDAIQEYADNHVSIYYSEQKEFYDEHTELCEDALKEYGYDLNEMLKTNTLIDIIYKAGEVGEYKYNHDKLSDEIDDILRVMTIDYCIKKEIDLTPEQIDEMIDSYLNNYRRFDDVISQIDYELKKEKDE